MAEIDLRYKRGVIYTIRNIKDDTMVYVGSTINNLSKRFWTHKADCKAGSSITLYKHIENNDWTDFYIELYEAYPCNNKRELERREGQVIREIGTINRYIAGRTYKEWCEDNPDKSKEYYEKNADKIKEREKEYYKKNADKIKEREKEYYKKNTDKIKEYQKEYNKDNAEKIKEKRKEYSIVNTENIKEYQKEWRKNNADKIKEYQKEKVCCDICGALSSKHRLARHQKTKKCMSKSLDNTDIPSDTHI